MSTSGLTTAQDAEIKRFQTVKSFYLLTMPSAPTPDRRGQIRNSSM